MSYGRRHNYADATPATLGIGGSEGPAFRMVVEWLPHQESFTIQFSGACGQNPHCLVAHELSDELNSHLNL